MGTPTIVPASVYFLNDNRIFRNAYSLSKTKPFDLATYPEATSKLVTFDQPRLVRVCCNIHPDKVSDILVLKKHYFFVTAGDGKYVIDRLPNGDYAVCVWAERADETERSIRVTGVCL